MNWCNSLHHIFYLSQNVDLMPFLQLLSLATGQLMAVTRLIFQQRRQERFSFYWKLPQRVRQIHLRHFRIYLQYSILALVDHPLIFLLLNNSQIVWKCFINIKKSLFMLEQKQHQKATVSYINTKLIYNRQKYQMLMEKNWSDALKLGSLTLKNRVFLAALTRERCDVDTNVPSPLVAEYYAQRAGAGLLLTQATAWSSRGRGFLGAACLYNKDHLEGWKLVLDAVHAKGGLLFLQIFHAGRATHPLKNGNQDPWAPSSIAIRQTIRDIGGKQFPIPKEMTLEDIEIVKGEFQHSIRLAKQAGFDGVQIHGAHGYLVDTFLRTSSNQRTDQYGGSAENRVRFVLELTDIALKYFEPARLGFKISPASRLKDMYDENPIQTYSLLLKELDKRQIGFVEVRQSTETYPFPNRYPLSQKEQIPDVCAAFRQYYSGLLIGNDSFNEQTGLQKIRNGLCDAVSFGRLYISNPDLAERIINGWEINKKWDVATFYGANLGANGYTDYPFFKS